MEVASPGLGSWLVNSPDLTKNTLADRSIINQTMPGVMSRAIVGTNDGNVQMASTQQGRPVRPGSMSPGATRPPNRLTLDVPGIPPTP
ncbi:MAG: hypothetical protein R2844_17915 [Caldilineales bacterium]